jgi:hypothetical protein
MAAVLVQHAYAVCPCFDVAWSLQLAPLLFLALHHLPPAMLLRRAT